MTGSCGDPNNANAAFIHQYRTTDKGYNWTVMNNCLSVYTYNPTGNKELYGSNGNGLVRSYDSGATWTTLVTLGEQVWDVAYDHVRNRAYMATSGKKLFQYDIGTSILTDITNRLPVDNNGSKRVKKVAVDPVDPSIVYTSDAGDTYATSNAVLYSTDAGMTWKSLLRQPGETGPDGGREAASVRVHPVTRDLWVGGGCYGMWKHPCPINPDPTSTPYPGTAVFSATATNTSVPPAPTNTHTAVPPTSTPVETANINCGATLDSIVYDMVGPVYRTTFMGQPWGRHEGVLNGVPSNYDWAEGARPGMWMNYQSNTAITPWGQVYEMAGNTERNVRIQIRNFALYAYVNGQWTLLESDSENIQGTWWKENFTGAIGYAASRIEPAGNGGGRSFEPKAGYNLHYWTSKWPRSTIPAGASAFYITGDIRLIPNTDPGVNLSNAKYLAGNAADYYPTNTSAGAGPWPSLGISRHKFVTAEWETYTAYFSGNAPTSVDGYRNAILSRPLPPGAVLSCQQTPVNTATNTPVISPTETPTPLEGMYVEDFNDNIAQEWTISTGLVVSGENMSSTGWVASTTGTYGGLVFSSPYNYKVNVNSAGGSAGNLTRILFNYADNNNYYFVEFTGGSEGTAALKKKVNGVETTVAGAAAYPTNGVWVTVEVIYENGHITVKTTKAGVQTTLFSNVADSSLTSGKIGVMTLYNNVLFDNVVVNYGSSVPTSTSTAVPPTATSTVVPPTATNTAVLPTATNTAVLPTATSTVVPPTATNTAVPPTATPMPSVVAAECGQGIVIDGSVSDAAWQDGMWMTNNRLITGTNPQNVTSKFKVRWDNTNLYVAVDVTDPSPNNDSGTAWYDDSSVEVYLDMNHNRSVTYGTDDFQFSMRYNLSLIHI